MDFAAAEFAAPAGGIFALAGGSVVALERWDVGPATVLVPTEDVLLLAVDLPISGRTQRLAALPFAIEGRIADPLDAVHVALGAEVGPRSFVAGVVRRHIMRGWIAALDAAGLGHAAIVPDALLLPVPPAGSWSVETAAGRVIVRTDTGAGFRGSGRAFRRLLGRGGIAAVRDLWRAAAVRLADEQRRGCRDRVAAAAHTGP